jgi:hypothetical protein
MEVVGGKMANLTSRQLQAEVLCRDLQRLGAWCLSPMPLREDARLRFQVLTGEHEELLEHLSNAGWSPILCNHGLRFTPEGAKPSIIYEIDIEHERQPVADDRTVKGEIASEKAAHIELEAFKKLRLS